MKKGVITILMLATAATAYLQTGKPGNKEAGKKVYNTLCIACHMVDGSGVPALNPPLQRTPFVLGDKKRLINIVLKGFNGPVEINDETYSNPMPAQPQLTDKQIADVLTYVRSSFGNKASAVTVEEVKAQRAAK